MVRIRMGTAVALLALAAAVSAGEFSAVITTETRGKTQSYPIHVKGKSYCMLQEEGGEKIRIVVDQERNVTTVILASKKAYLEMPCDSLRSKSNDPIQGALHIPKELVKRDAGQETLEGYECEKREYTVNDKLYQTVWFSTELGLPLKIEQHQGGVRKFKVTDFKHGPVDAALFKVPAGFEKMEKPERPESKPTPTAKPKPMMQGTAYGRAPWGRRLAPGAEARIHFDQQSQPKVTVRNESSRTKASATVRFFLHGTPQGKPSTLELYANGRKEVEKRFGTEVNEARVRVDEGACFVTVDQTEKMGSSDKLDLSFLRAPMQRQVMLRAQGHVRVVVRGHDQDGPASEVRLKLSGQGGSKEHSFVLENGKFWRLSIAPEEKISTLEAHVQSGAVELQVMQGSRVKPLAPLRPGAGGQISRKENSLVVGAINYDHVQWMRAALDAGLTPGLQVGRRPMIYLVASKASPEMLALVIEKGADVKAVEKGGLCLLGAAAQNPRYWRENISLLLEKGADVKFKNRFGFTPLHYAVMSAGGGKPEVLGSARLLIEKGADVNAPLQKGDTPLLKAVQGNDVALVKLLMEYGANVNAKGNRGRTPMSEAEKMGNAEIVEALKSKPPEK